MLYLFFCSISTCHRLYFTYNPSRLQRVILSYPSYLRGTSFSRPPLPASFRLRLQFFIGHARGRTETLRAHGVVQRKRGFVFRVEAHLES